MHVADDATLVLLAGHALQELASAPLNWPAEQAVMKTSRVRACAREHESERQTAVVREVRRTRAGRAGRAERSRRTG